MGKNYILNRFKVKKLISQLFIPNIPTVQPRYIYFILYEEDYEAISSPFPLGSGGCRISWLSLQCLVHKIVWFGSLWPGYACKMFGSDKKIAKSNMKKIK